MAKVKVYYFTKFDPNFTVWKDKQSQHMATLEAIKAFEGTALLDTEKEVELTDLDEIGRYMETSSPKKSS